MIKSFVYSETERLFRRLPARFLPKSIQRVAYRKLLLLDSAVDLFDLKAPPGNRLEALSGNRLGQYSIRVNQKYRLCFCWERGDAYQVEIIVYH